MKRKTACFITSVLCFTAVARVFAQSVPSPAPRARIMAPSSWRSPARWRHSLKKTAGTLSLDDSGVDFLSAEGHRLRWSFEEIQTFDLSPHYLTVMGYQNRAWHVHGESKFSFDLALAMPPGIAAELAQRVAKPAENGIPDPNAPAFATLGARRQIRGGGTNGVLRFGKSGVDYVTPSGRGARSWRWADIQTLAHPDPFHFRVGTYREIFEFELKQPMPGELFDELWNDVYARDLIGVNPQGGVRP